MGPRCLTGLTHTRWNSSVNVLPVLGSSASWTHPVIRWVRETGERPVLLAHQAVFGRPSPVHRARDALLDWLLATVRLARGNGAVTNAGGLESAATDGTDGLRKELRLAPARA